MVLVEDRRSPQFDPLKSATATCSAFKYSSWQPSLIYLHFLLFQIRSWGPSAALLLLNVHRGYRRLADCQLTFRPSSQSTDTVLLTLWLLTRYGFTASCSWFLLILGSLCIVLDARDFLLLHLPLPLDASLVTRGGLGSGTERRWTMRR